MFTHTIASMSAEMIANTAIATAWAARSCEIRPLQLVDLQPVDAVERSRRLGLQFHPVNLSASPVSGIGGLGLAILIGLVTLVTPATWWLLLVSALAGGVLGIVMIAVRDHAASSRSDGFCALMIAGPFQ
jgi:hypothetical protein